MLIVRTRSVRSSDRARDALSPTSSTALRDLQLRLEARNGRTGRAHFARGPIEVGINLERAVDGDGFTSLDENQCAIKNSESPV